MTIIVTRQTAQHVVEHLARAAVLLSAVRLRGTRESTPMRQARIFPRRAVVRRDSNSVVRRDCNSKLDNEALRERENCMRTSQPARASQEGA
jgi:hypothetical protein